MTNKNSTSYIEIIGAQEHNLKNVNLKIPSNSLVVFTGLSGSGKSSLAFDTIFAEGQRRYLETFSAYARQFIGDMKRPKVDKIDGLSPVISIEQKTVSRNPRSTVGTITEVYDFLRLLFARTSKAYSYLTGNEMVKYSEEQIISTILKKYENLKVVILAPLIKGRKGHYRELFDQWQRNGYNQVRVDGKIIDLKPGLQLDRYKIHDIELVIDKIEPDEKNKKRLIDSVRLALKIGKGYFLVKDSNSEKIDFYSKFLMEMETGLSYDEPQPNLFSFNSPYGACQKCNGIGSIRKVSINQMIPDFEKSISSGGILPLGEYKDNFVFNQIKAIGTVYNFKISDPISKIPKNVLDILLNGSSELFSFSYTNYEGRKQNIEASFKGVINIIEDQYYEGKSDSLMRWAEEFMHAEECSECKGGRLNNIALNFKLNNKNIAELSNFSLTELKEWTENLTKNLSERENLIAFEILKEINTRLGFLINIGIDYLTLNSPASTLSGGEAQRIRLATQISSQLTNVLYILDEPSIGLHQRDNSKLIESLKNLRDIGNSIIVVEHDKEMMEASDYIVDIGPGAGVNGGNIVAHGTFEEFIKQNSTTAQFINGKKSLTVEKSKRSKAKEKIILQGCSGHNLKNVDVEFPLGQMILVTGVSGSGKSSLINETLYPILAKHVYKSNYACLPYKKINGLKNIDKVIRIDQSPIGRTPRSNPATYTGVFTDIRNLFSMLPEAKIRGYKPGRFSFNVKGGRCETCKGGGLKVIQMNFLPDVEVLCEECNGKRYNRETLEIRYKGKSINDVLNLPIDQALHFFENYPLINRRLQTLVDVGLGYLTLGQSSTTISGGEAQRVKLAEELSKKDTGATFYILDEPTTGLHFQDINVLMGVLNQLVDKGNTVLIIEHNLDVIKQADYIIDLGPEGGSRGGEIIATGTPQQIIKNKKSITGIYLAKEI